ncbi:hypothetical protein [Lentibacillus amyloliquefaciens]|uniref:Uncharacterized protein n=1 Tax=Lentibacillus amyloliquefaciens TaxID=1472767 RepID=A0A0U4EBB1_9BACI|nr:hypothetical protein [Lentibacillus amyloliquefaciens]ALX47849.1 hypothetical protein AOX59_04070 [Lentibacillus amyloliquefaciens]
MNEIKLNEKQMELVRDCRELQKELKPNHGEKTDEKLIELALNTYKWFMQEDLKLREEGY